ncbi:hypothetical protein [Candidatus Symbiopectobacterium sp. NZEC135]|uniref:hypothetical protein n=1 Tax=Candidatus Symbiopectobacterium sp. NZEC135 TaxID=2820471 RepID=UPI002226B68C|nr:hypothetical protein [Candidatus Symbiopectobacterium sp. NZEC135]MCW2479573.1 hypothetical protein [Candidatus Symbiopectobacterium sp. NZEC135]
MPRQRVSRRGPFLLGCGALASVGDGVDDVGFDISDEKGDESATLPENTPVSTGRMSVGLNFA